MKEKTIPTINDAELSIAKPDSDKILIIIEEQDTETGSNIYVNALISNESAVYLAEKLLKAARTKKTICPF
ncbi:hypothetical protein [Dysgonomonas sp.]